METAVGSYASTPRVIPRTSALVPRMAAFGVDLVILAGLTYVAWIAAGAVGFLPPTGELESYGFLLVAELPLGLLYFTLTEGTMGRSVGKLALGLRIATLRGERATALQAFLRNLVRFVWATPVGPFFLILDAYLLLTTEMDQRLGDLAAGTIVVDVVERVDEAV